MTNGIRHPKFQRRTQTEYIMTTTEPVRHAILHVGQIANYLAFDKALRNGRRVSDLPGLPIGYIEFAHVFNTGATSKDHRRISTVSFDDGETYVVKSKSPVSTQDFAITSVQCGIPEPREDESELLVLKEYAKDLARQKKRREDAYQNRKNKQQSLFDNDAKRGSSTSKHHNDSFKRNNDSFKRNKKRPRYFEDQRDESDPSSNPHDQHIIEIYDDRDSGSLPEFIEGQSNDQTDVVPLPADVEIPSQQASPYTPADIQIPSETTANEPDPSVQELQEQDGGNLPQTEEMQMQE